MAAKSQFNIFLFQKLHAFGGTSFVFYDENTSLNDITLTFCVLREVETKLAFQSFSGKWLMAY